MKKLIGVVILWVTAFSVFAETSGRLPEGRELLPILWKYAFEQPVQQNEESLKNGGKIIKSFKVILQEINPISNEYVFEEWGVYKDSPAYFKKENKQFSVRQDGQNITVDVLKDKWGIYTIYEKDVKPKDWNDFTRFSDGQELINIFLKSAKNMSDDEYNKWYDMAFYSIAIQNAVSSAATNKLKAKQWYTAHSMVGKDVSTAIIVTNIDESIRKGYSYKVVGSAIDSANRIAIEFYTNNDKYIDIAKGTKITIGGTAAEVNYSDTQDYRIKSIVIEE